MKKINILSTLKFCAPVFLLALFSISTLALPKDSRKITATTLKVNFQDETTVPPSGWLRDFGQPYGPRSSAYQGTGNTYGWININNSTPVDFTDYGRRRNSPSDLLLATFMHIERDAVEARWEALVDNGTYTVTVSAGDGEAVDSKHTVSIEGVTAISNFTPTSSNRFQASTVTVTVSDGRLTVDGIGGINTKINYINIQPAATGPSLSFSPASLSYTVVEDGTTANKSSTLSASTGTPTVSLTKSANSNWLVMPSAGLGSLSFGINASGLAPGDYSATVTASASGYSSGTCTISLEVNAAGTTSGLKVNFQDQATVPPTGWLRDFGQAYGARTSANQGTGNTYGWINLNNSNPLDFTDYGRRRNSPSDLLLATFMHIERDAVEARWEALLANGTYTVTVSAGDGEAVDSKHTVRVEGVTAISNFTPTTSNRFQSGTVTVTVSDGRLTVDGIGGINTKINYINIQPAAMGPSLSFSPASLSYTVVEDGTTANKSSTLSASTGTPTVSLTKSANSSWLVLPSAGLGSLSFAINAAGLAPGNYTSTVTASASGYANATLQVTLVVGDAPALSFSPASLAYTVTQNGTTPNKSSTLSVNTGAPTVTLAKSANSNWLVLPSAALGSLSFGVNAAGLSAGSYTSTVTASASGYANATMQVTLVVSAQPVLSFSPTSLSYTVVQNGTTANKTSVLSASSGSPTITLSKSANSNWLTLPAAQLGTLSFGINASGLAAGNYSSVVTASASGYASAVCNITLQVNAAAVLTNLKVNFQDAATVPPSGWIRDFGQPYAARTSPNQGTGNTYGWINKLNSTPLDLSQNGRDRNAPADVLLATFMHMQGGDVAGFSGNPAEGRWEAQVVNGTYDITVSVGDETKIDSRHSVNAEGVGIIAAFVPTTSIKFKSATAIVTVSDGRLTLDATGGTNTKINWVNIQPASNRPSVLSVNPVNGAVDVSEYSSISTDILRLPSSGIDNETITSSTVYLTENATGIVVPSNVNGTGGGDAITLVSGAALKFNTVYKFNITSGVKDLSGNSFMPFSSTFTTTSNSKPPTIAAQFERVELPNTIGRHSNLTIGPDNKLYAVTIEGLIERYSINSNGTLSTPQLIYSLQDAYGPRTPRLAVGFAFDPAATSTNLIAYITHSTFVFLDGPDWDGKLTKLSGNNLQTVRDLLINLPRSAKDHLSNSIAFGPDDALYFTQGSNSAMGRADQTWSFRDEHLLSGAVLRLDLSKLGASALNVKTSEGGGTYNPYAANAALTIYASGVRNAYDLLWHTNGSLYAPTNGSAANGNTPASVNGTLRPDGSTYNGPVVPELTNVLQTMRDYLFRVVDGGYYGHPNPLRGEYVMNGGNPSSTNSPAKVPSYPVGTLPDVNWRGSAFDFKNNASPDGVIEYRSNTFGGALRGKILVVRYSQHDDIITLTPDASKNIGSFAEGQEIPGFTGFIDPLDLVEDTRNGNIYVSEYGGQDGKIVLLRPTTPSAARAAAYAKKGSPATTKSSGNTMAGCDEGAKVILVPESTNLPLVLQAAKISPNPVHKRFNIQFPGTYEGEHTLQIINPLGTTFQVRKINLKGGGSNMEIDISKLFLRAGIYFLRITAENKKTEVLKLFVE